MFLNLWRRVVKKHSQSSRRDRNVSRQRKPGFKPGMEVLESRMLLSTWTGLAGDGLWSTGHNWDTEVPPSAEDTAILTASSIVDPLFVGGTIAGLDLSGGTLTVNQNLTLTGSSTWSVGNIGVGAGFSLTNSGSGTITLGGPANKGLSGLLKNEGIITHGGTGDLLMLPDGDIVATIDNRPEATYEFQVGREGGTLLAYGSRNPTFINAGTLRKSGSFRNLIVVDTFDNQGGKIDVQEGTLVLNNSKVKNTDGVFNADGGATLELTNLDSSEYTGTYTGSGAGKIVVGYGTIKAGTGGLIFNFPQDSPLRWTPGPLGGNYSIIDGGLGGVTNQGWIKLEGAVGKVLAGLLRNDGTITHAGTGYLSLQDNANSELDNFGVYDLQAGDGAQIFGPTGIFNNAGTLSKSSSGTNTIYTSVFSNTGTVDVKMGTLATFVLLPSESFTNEGNLIIEVGGTFQVYGDYTQLGSSTLEVQLGGAAFGQLKVTGKATLAGTLLVDPYDGNPGDTFKILTYGTVAGDFDYPPDYPVWDVLTGTVSF